MTDGLRITIVGAGATGGLVGACLARAGNHVSFIARGAHLQAIREKGLQLRSDTGEGWSVHVPASDNGEEIGEQDVVFVCVKSHQIEGAIPTILPLLGKDTSVVFSINGIPWWYFQKEGGRFEGRTIKSLDREKVILDAIHPDRVIGCANYLAATIAEPGVIHYVDRFEPGFVIGEIDNAESDRMAMLTKVCEEAGLNPRATTRIRTEVWNKLWANIAFNPVSALTHATMDRIVREYDDTDLLMAIMNEGRFIGEKLGIEFRNTPYERIEAAAKMRGHKTSMLQDIEAGRPTEIRAIVGAVREIGTWLEESTPHLNGLYSLVRLKERFYQN